MYLSPVTSYLLHPRGGRKGGGEGPATSTRSARARALSNFIFRAYDAAGKLWTITRHRVDTVPGGYRRSPGPSLRKLLTRELAAGMASAEKLSRVSQASVRFARRARYARASAVLFLPSSPPSPPGVVS